MTRPWVIAVLCASALHLGALWLPAPSPSEAPKRKQLDLRLSAPPPRKAVVEADAAPVEAPPARERVRPMRRARPRPVAATAPTVVPPSPAAAPESSPAVDGSEAEDPIAAAPAPKAAPAPVPPPPAPPADLGPFRASTLAAVQAQERYPRRARRLRQQGVVEVKVRLQRGGAIEGAPEVIRSSGHRMLDDEAVRMVRAAAPFGALPRGHAGVVLELPIRFVLRR